MDAKRWRFPSARLDVVLMDVQMPEMDGFQATAAIRACEKTTGVHLPIVALTAHALKGDSERCIASGMDAHLSKPIRAHDLDRVLAEVLRIAHSEPRQSWSGLATGRCLGSKTA